MNKFTQEDLNKQIAKVPLFFHTDSITRNERLAICNACDKKQKFIAFDHCVLCKCLIAFKVSFKGAGCPLNKWIPAPKPTEQECIDNNIKIK